MPDSHAVAQGHPAASSVLRRYADTGKEEAMHTDTGKEEAMQVVF